MKIDQTSQRAIINWQGFNIGSNAQVTFNQPNAAAIALNRVLSANPTTIAGKLSANGQVFLVNPSGITFANGSQVDVGGLVASTMSISDADFLAGKNLFQRNGSTAGVTNEGSLTAGPGGYIGLLAPQIRNEGVISARLGAVVLAAGEAVTLDFTGSGNVAVKVDPATVKTLIENHHLIAAPDGQVFMSAQAAGVLMGGVINNKGIVEADSLSSDGGKITLAASGNIRNSGTIRADAINNGNGGNISVVAQGTNTVGGTLSARGGAAARVRAATTPRAAAGGGQRGAREGPCRGGAAVERRRRRRR
jgi:filamentous hemagglutinin family protein